MYNKTILVGRLTANPELKQTPNGISVVSFCLAVDRAYSAKGEERQTDFINCVAWRQTAEFISKYFSKGRLIRIDGSIQTRSYEDKQGNKRTAVEVVVNNAFFTESKKTEFSGNQSIPLPTEPPSEFGSYTNSDELPY